MPFLNIKHVNCNVEFSCLPNIEFLFNRLSLELFNTHYQETLRHKAFSKLILQVVKSLPESAYQRQPVNCIRYEMFRHVNTADLLLNNKKHYFHFPLFSFDIF